MERVCHLWAFARIDHVQQELTLKRFLWNQGLVGFNPGELQVDLAPLQS